MVCTLPVAPRKVTTILNFMRPPKISLTKNAAQTSGCLGSIHVFGLYINEIMQYIFVSNFFNSTHLWDSFRPQDLACPMLTHTWAVPLPGLSQMLRPGTLYSSCTRSGHMCAHVSVGHVSKGSTRVCIRSVLKDNAHPTPLHPRWSSLCSV